MKKLWSKDLTWEAKLISKGEERVVAGVRNQNQGRIYQQRLRLSQKQPPSNRQRLL